MMACFKLSGIPSGLILALKSSSCSAQMLNSAAASRILPPWALFSESHVLFLLRYPRLASVAPSA